MGTWLKRLGLLLLAAWFAVQVVRNGIALRQLYREKRQLETEIAVLQAKRVLLQHRLRILSDPDSAVVFVLEHRYPRTGGTP